MFRNRTYLFAMTLLSIGAALALPGCGGGAASEATTAAAGSVSGAATKGPVSGATVTAYVVNADGTVGAAMGSATTDAQGAFTVSTGSYTGPMLLKLSGGNYTDEATGTAMGMRSGDTMSAALPSMTAGSAVGGVQITPLTSMAESMAEHMSGALSMANVASANQAVGAYFMVQDILHTPPMNPIQPGSAAGASASAKNYGMVLAAMSQSARDVGMPRSSAMVTAFMNDASDGVLDGKAGASPIAMGGGMTGQMMMSSSAGTRTMADAIARFVASGRNMSGVTVADMTELMRQLAASDGHIMH